MEKQLSKRYLYMDYRNKLTNGTYARFILISFFLLAFLSESIAAQAGSFNLHVRNKPITDVIDQLEKSGDYFFMYDENLSGIKEKVTVTFKDETIEQVMRKLLAKTNLEFTIKDNQIILSEKKFVANQSDKKVIVSGKILDEFGEPVIGANVVEQGTSNGTMTDLDGSYRLEVGERSSLQVSYIGYTTQRIPVNGRNTIIVNLSEDSQLIEEVVVVGYGVQKKVNLTGAISQVNADVLESRPISNLTQGLQGVIPNLNVTISDGAPNSDGSLNIRGTASINGGSPLVLIDGVQMSLNMINPEDVESITVLKDASSAAIYGARGAFGVILITTKSGKKDRKPVIDYSGSLQFNTHTYLPDLLSAVDYMDASNEASFNQSGNQKYSDDQVQWVKDYNADPENNPVYHMLSNGKIFWNGGNQNYKQMLQKWAPTHKHTVSVNGGSQQVSFYASLGFMNQEGMFKDATDIFKRYNFLGNINANITSNFRLGFKASYTQTIYDEPHRYTAKGSSWWEQMTRGEPQILYPIVTPEDSPVGGGVPTEHFYNFLTSGSRNVVHREVGLFMLNGELDVIDGLQIKGDFSYTTTNYRSKDVQREFGFIRDSWTLQNNATFPSFIQTETRHTDYFAGNLYANYLKSFNKVHNVGAVIGFNQEWQQYRMQNIYRDELVSNDVPTINLGTGQTTTKDSEYSWAIRGAFMRFNYDYDGKYLLEFSARYDGTSKFPHATRFGFFPSFSAGWRISQEKFMSASQSWLTDLKLRVSYGSLGNQNVTSNYPYIESFGVTQQTAYLIDGALPLSVSPPGLVASDLTWETARTFNIGTDVVLLRKLSAGFDWYQRRTYDMLVAGEKLPAVLGTNVPNRNTAHLKTQGWELTLKWLDKLSNGLRYDVGLVLSDYKSTITKYDNNPNKLYSTYYVGQRIGEIWGYETEGIFQSAEEVVAHADQTKLGNGGKWGPGDVKYKDLNDDDVIDWGDSTVENPGDTKIIGNTTPRFRFGITINAEWKGFDLNVFFQGVGKRDFFPTGNYFWGQINNAAAIGTYEVYKNAWREDNPGGFYPMWKGASIGYNGRTQTRYLQSGAYARLKNLTFGYTLPSALTRQVHLNKVRFYFSGQNLFDISGIKGNFDPEIAGAVGQYYPLQRSILFGVQLSLQ